MSLFYVGVEMTNLDNHKKEGVKGTSLTNLVLEFGKKYIVVSPLALKLLRITP